ncbi:hypothetical protein Gogos_013387 [Gossypium gossypioides]|uniref:Uncharacterized protein n=3 Tax=Gossypium TaxID=3633 RepID=A0A7J9BVH9_GOSGO|nr:hypothetical protein [Gossypium gossypioides]
MSLAIHKWEKRHAGLLMLRLLTKKLFRRTKYGPKKEGHFAVVTVKGGEKKRFILELKYLRKPEFLRLLEQAKEEYEFQQEGVLILPSQPKSCRIF